MLLYDLISYRYLKESVGVKLGMNTPCSSRMRGPCGTHVERIGVYGGDNEMENDPKND